MIVPLAIIIGVLIPTTLSNTLQIFLIFVHFLEAEKALFEKINAYNTRI